MRSSERVIAFRLGIDVRTAGKRATEATVCCWREIGRFAQDLVVGDRVVVAGSLGHMAGLGLCVSCLQLARLGNDEVLANVQREAPEPDETNWIHHLDLGAPGARR